MRQESKPWGKGLNKSRGQPWVGWAAPGSGDTDTELERLPRLGDPSRFPLLPQGLISDNMCLSSTEETELLPWEADFFAF